MTALKAHEVPRFLSRPDLDHGIFLAYGPDAGLVREVGQKLVAHFGRDGTDADGLVTLDGSEVDADPGRLTVEARMPSLFGGRRIVRVRSAGKSAVMPLSDLKDDPAGSVVILEAGNLPPKDPLRALVETARLGRALPCYPDSDETVLSLIRESFSSAGIALDADAAQTLRDILGNDREITRREIEKLQLFAAETRLVTREDVLTLCADNGALVLDEIIDAMATGHAAHMEAALNRALAAAISPQQLISASTLHFAQLRRWRAEVDAGKSPRDVLAGARPRPHFSRTAALEQQLRLWDDAAIAATASRLHLATGDSRKRYDLQETLVRRAFLAVCLQAAER